MNDLSTLENIRKTLHQSLSRLSALTECALLDYPKHYNLGDQLIWLGTIFYLNNVINIKINYASSLDDFSHTKLIEKVGKAPIIFHGGGNLGDLWPRSQRFREKIISEYHDRPIFILPQTLYFQNKENLRKTALIFNQHPNLTLFLRDNYSYDLAGQHFVNCHLAKAPDLAFEMVNLPKLSIPVKKNNSILYLYRKDKEKNSAFDPSKLDIPNLVVEDWISYQWMTILPKNWLYIPGLVKLIREGWQRGLSVPDEWVSRQKWDNFHPYVSVFNALDNPSIHRKSWSMMHSGIYQLSKYRLVITNRLHVHILCSLLNIPHVFVSGAYYKNETFYNSWTYQLPFVRFVKEPTEVKLAVEELNDLF